jgi:hypothetical protein
MIVSALRVRFRTVPPKLGFCGFPSKACLQGSVLDYTYEDELHFENSHP